MLAVKRTGGTPMTTQHQSRFIETTIAVFSLIAFSTTAGHAAPKPSETNAPSPAAQLGEVLTPTCPESSLYPFPSVYCSTGESLNLDQGELNELAKQMNDRLQLFRRAMESDKLIIPLVRITLP
jgi:hypothetical protein